MISVMILVFKMQYLAIEYLGLNTSMQHLCLHEYEENANS